MRLVSVAAQARRGVARYCGGATTFLGMAIAAGSKISKTVSEASAMIAVGLEGANPVKVAIVILLRALVRNGKKRIGGA